MAGITAFLSIYIALILYVVLYNIINSVSYKTGKKYNNNKAAYALLSTNKIENGKLYQILNLVAAILMVIGLYSTKAWFSFALQIIWALVALIAIIKMIKKK